jgi:hypothetical protein
MGVWLWPLVELALWLGWPGPRWWAWLGGVAFGWVGVAFGWVGVVLGPWRGRRCWRLYALPIASLPSPSPNSLAEVGVVIEAADLLHLNEPDHLFH